MDSKATLDALNPKQRGQMAQQVDWLGTDWMREPGLNCSPLEPAGTGVVKTLPDPEQGVYDQELPHLYGEVRSINETYLEVSSGLAGNKWMAVLPALFFTVLTVVGAPLLVWLAFIESGFFEYMLLKVLFLATIPVFFLMSYDFIGKAFLSPEDEPIRFNRADKKIYRYRARRWRFWFFDLYLFGKPEIKVCSWTQCRAEVSRRLITTGITARRDCLLELAVLDPETQKVIERFGVGDRDVFGDIGSRVLLWETIRRYMQEGSKRIPVSYPEEHRGTLVDCMDDFNPFSIPAKSAPGAQRIFGYFFGAIVLAAGLLVLPMALSHWVAIKSSRKIDWGELDNTTFKIAPDDPSRLRSLQPEFIGPHRWEDELKRRLRAAVMWLAASALQLVIVWWYVFYPSYYD